MGTNISVFVECYQDIRWRDADRYARDNDSFYRVPLYDGQEYLLFAVLANVRNHYNNPYICEPKGMPQDANCFIKEHKDFRFARDISYLTLRELKDFKEKTPFLHYGGIISPESQKELDENGTEPDERFNTCHREGWEHRTWETKNTVLDELILKLEERALEESSNPDHIRIVFGFEN